MKSVFLSILLALSTAGCKAVSKNPSTPQVSPNVSQPQGKTITWAEKGISFTVPKDWQRDKNDESDDMTWIGPANAKILIHIAPYKPESGNASIESETAEFYESHKRYNEENLRYLEISGVKGVYYLRSQKGWDEHSRPQDQKLTVWAGQRMYKGVRQVIFVHVTSPAETFTKDRNELYEILQSIKFTDN
jgi:hypothetical protein